MKIPLEVLGLVETTLDNLGDKLIDVTQESQNYAGYDLFFGPDGAKKYTKDGGKQVSRPLLVSGGDTFQDSSMYEEDDLVVEDVEDTITVPWAMSKFHYAYDARETEFNDGPAQIVDHIKAKATAAWLGMFEAMDLRAASCPASTAKNVMYGLPYWLSGLDDGQAGAGFYGGANTAAGYTSTAGIDEATSGDNTTAITGGEARWRHYAVGGTGYYGTDVDLTAFESMKTMYRATGFKSPTTREDLFKIPAMRKLKLVTNEWFINRYERLVDNRNDNFGGDAAKFADATSFKRIPLLWWPQLDSDLRDPLYFLNMNHWEVIMPSGSLWRTSKPEIASAGRAHNQIVVWNDATYAVMCRNRRMQGVLRKTAARS